MTIRTPDGDIDLLVHLTDRRTLAQVLPQLLQAAGLDDGADLYLGGLPVDPEWWLGSAPLLSATVLHTAQAGAPEVGGPVVLACVAGPDAGGSVVLDGRPVLIGRGPEADLRLADPEVSGVHAVLTPNPNGPQVIDAGSTNGTQMLHWSTPAGYGPGEPLMLIRVGGSLLRSGLSGSLPLRLRPDGMGRIIVERPPRRSNPLPSTDPISLPPAATLSGAPLPVLGAVAAAGSGLALGALTGSWAFLLVTMVWPVMSMGAALVQTRRDRARAPGRSQRTRRRTARRAASAQRAAWQVAARADVVEAWERSGDPATLLRSAPSPTSGCGHVARPTRTSWS